MSFKFRVVAHGALLNFIFKNIFHDFFNKNINFNVFRQKLQILFSGIVFFRHKYEKSYSKKFPLPQLNFHKFLSFATIQKLSIEINKNKIDRCELKTFKVEISKHTKISPNAINSSLN